MHPYVRTDRIATRNTKGGFTQITRDTIEKNRQECFELTRNELGIVILYKIQALFSSKL